MKRIIDSGTIILLLLVSAGSSPLHAETECYSPPPGYDSITDYRFTPIPEVELTRSQFDSLEALFSRLDGSWGGRYFEKHCRGSTDSPELFEREYTVNAIGRFDRTHPSLVIDASMNSSEVSKPATFELYLDEEKRALYYRADSSGNEVHVTSLDDDHMDFIRKYVVRSAAGGVIRHEIHVEIVLENNTVRITENNYTNGQLIGWNDWHLD